MAAYQYTLKQFLRDWALIVSMIVGASSYLAYHALPVLHFAGPVLAEVVTRLQPMLLFVMLFLSFCRIEPHQMRPHRWMLWLLVLQGGLFVLLALLLAFVPNLPMRHGVEAFMRCIICPTATACAVITGKLGGNMAGVLWSR